MYIKRLGEEFLDQWRQREKRKPLIVRGARQVGKSRMIAEFGKQHFQSFVSLNLEKEPQLRDIFSEGFNIKNILNQIELIKNISIDPGNSLIFIDEIQACPKAITQLRYFYEDMPELHVIAAGSLLEFVLRDDLLSFPVGRVEFYYLFPLSFAEYLGGAGKDKLLKYLSGIEPKQKIPPLIHQELRGLLRDYFLIGGMPEASAQFLGSGRYKECEPILESIIETYKEDFKKYSTRVNLRNLEFIFRQAPRMIGTRVNLTELGEGVVGVREAKVALDLLERAMVVYRVHQIESVSFPMIPSPRRHPKILFLDSGMAQYINRISKEIAQSKNYSSIYKGGFAEQFVGQELLPLLGSLRHPELFYWQKERPHGAAEMDYLYPHGTDLIPIEVKSAKGTSLASLHQFMHQYKPPFAIRLYDGELDHQMIEVALPQDPKVKVKYPLLSVPLYLTHHLPRLIEAFRK